MEKAPEMVNLLCGKGLKLQSSKVAQEQTNKV